MNESGEAATVLECRKTLNSTWKMMNFGPGPDDESDGIEPEAEHKDDDDHVLHGDLGELRLPTGRWTNGLST